MSILYDLDQEELLNVYDQTLSLIVDAYEDGELSEDEAYDLIENADSDLEEVAEEQGWLGEGDGLDEEDDGEDFEEEEEDYYASDDDVALFRAPTTFGNALILAAEDQGYESLEDLVIDLSDQFEVDPDDVIQILTDKVTVDYDTVLDIADALGIPESDTTTVTTLLQCAAIDNGDDPELLIQEIETAYGEEYEDPEELIEEALDEYDEAIAEQEEDLADQDYRLAEIEAQFRRAEYRSDVLQELYNLERRADYGIQEGWLPPFAKQELLGNFAEEEDKVAAFSTLCATQDIEPKGVLHGIEQALDLFERCGGLINFSAMAYQEPLDPEELSLQEATFAEARRNVRHRRASTSQFNQQDITGGFE